MKRFVFIALMLLVTVGSSFCGGSKDKKPEKGRNKDSRGVTVINNTGTEIKGYAINVAGSHVEIRKANKNFAPGGSFWIEIPKSFKDDPQLEVVLVDIYEKVYAKEFYVPEKGNTDISLTNSDRKSEGLIIDKWKDFVAWLNKHK